MVASGMVRLADISSSTLVCAMDSLGADGEPKENLEDREISVLENILDANDFDAIPLIPERGCKPRRIARRRYHDGDPLDVFILGVEEVDRFRPDGSILDAIMSVLSNEHHIALVGSGDQIDSILTLDTLAQPNSSRPKIREYLDQKVADVASEHDEGLPANLSRDIFQGIRDMAKLITNDRTGVSDRKFTQLAIDVLLKLQPLKQHSETEVDYYSKKVPGESWIIRRDDQPTAASLARPMIGVLDSGDKQITSIAADSISAANDFSNLLILSESHEPIGLFKHRARSKSGRLNKLRKRQSPWYRGDWIRDEISGMEPPTQKIENIIGRLCNQANKEVQNPHLVVELDGGILGIITSEELSDPPALLWLLRRFATLELDLKRWLLEQGILEIKTGHRYRRLTPVSKASMGDLLYHKAFSNLKMRGRRAREHDIRPLTRLRNAIVHEALGVTSYSIDLIQLRKALQVDRALRQYIREPEEE